MFCPKCNSDISEGSTFCAACGYCVPEQNDSSPADIFEPKPASALKKANVPAIILAVLLTISIGILIYSFSENSKLSDENATHLSTIHDNETRIGFLERSVDAKTKEIIDLKDQVYSDIKEKALLSSKVEYSAELMKVLSSEEKWGYATENFHVDKGVMVIDRFGGMQELKLYSNYYTTFTFEVSDTNVCIAKWSDEEWINKDTTVYITPVSAGFATITFSNDLYATTFKVLVIVE